MISVLIPVFNIEVVSLVKELSRQFEHLSIRGEILVFDDFSSSSYRKINKSLIGLDKVVYKELDRNYGRAAIRQFLATQARFEWLLFLDSDSRILTSDFLERYVAAFRKGADVYSGGRSYPPRPIECNKRLHWKYGVKRESVKGNRTSFHTNNFCIKKETFQQLEFPQFLNQYGHEDTWMGIELEKAGKSIHHISNAVEHLQIESNEIFLRKTDQALQNLLSLKKVADEKLIAKHVSLFKAYSFVRNSNLEFGVTFLYRIFARLIAQNLNSCNPSLIFFDFYRLHRLIQISKN